MVWEQRGATVVMMTKLEERSRVSGLHLKSDRMLSPAPGPDRLVAPTNLNTIHAPYLKRRESWKNSPSQVLHRPQPYSALLDLVTCCTQTWMGVEGRGRGERIVCSEHE